MSNWPKRSELKKNVHTGYSPSLIEQKCIRHGNIPAVTPEEVEAEQEAKELLEDINLAESYMVNEITVNLRRKLNKTSLKISNELDRTLPL